MIPARDDLSLVNHKANVEEQVFVRLCRVILSHCFSTSYLAHNYKLSSTSLLPFVFKDTNWTWGLLMSLGHEFSFKMNIFGKFSSNFIVVFVMAEILWSEKLEE